MDPITALWHVLNFVATPLAVAALTAALARLIWCRALAGVPFTRLAGRTAWAALAVWTVALAVQGREGTMAGYAALLLVVAAVLAWQVGRRA